MASGDTDLRARLEWTVGDRLRKSRKAAGLSSQQMADYLGVHRNSVTNYERDGSQAPGPVLRLWAQRTGVALRWLKDGAGPRLGAPSTKWWTAPPGILNLAA